MSRKRLSWMNRKADPYTLNQEREQPAHDEYLIGDPSAFAEDVHQPLPDDPELGRNEIGQPNMPESNLTHKDVNGWDSDQPYDNAYTFSPADRDRTAAQQREASRDVYAHLERKAFQCVKIADALFPGAPESLIEEQAFDFMSLPDEVVISTVVRLAEKHEEDEEGEEAEKKEKEDKKASFDEDRIEAMLREMLAEDEEDDEEDDDEEDDDGEDDDDEDDDDDEVEAMLREMLAEEDEEDEDEKEAGTPMDMGTHAEEDPEIEAMIADMMEEGGDDHAQEMAQAEEHGAMDMEIEMEPTMDTVDSEIAEDDSVLASIFNDTVPKEAQTKAPQKRKASNKGVQTLGGRVKAAADGGGDDVDLSKLWQSDPDVSDVF